MQTRVFAALLAIACAPPGFGCDSSSQAAPTDRPDQDRGGDRARADAATGDTTPTDTTLGDAASGDGSHLALPDPALDGPYAIAERDETTTIGSTGHGVDLHVAYPTAGGPFPVVVFAHGYQLPPSQYYGYVQRLASFGYVALTVDFPTGYTSNDNPEQARDLLGGIDWAATDPALASRVDATRAAMSGHSLGGKLALLAATMDARVKASFVLDPVDGGGPSGCSAPECVTVKNLMPDLHVPTGFLGETTDATGSFQACAPEADNFATFYAQANSPSVEITAIGANHMSFLDDASSCGLACLFCNAATVPNAQVTDMARALMVAFYERHLRGTTAYDTYVTGAEAQSRYVSTSAATIRSK